MSLAFSGAIVGASPQEAPPALPGRLADLPAGARVYLAGLTLVGGLALLAAPSEGSAHWLLLAALTAGGSLAALARVDLPFESTGATMSLSFAFSFGALLLLGPQATCVVAAVSAWVQCTIGLGRRNPPHRTAFSMAAAVVTAVGASLVFIGAP